ncbi:MAG: hypothetical protein E6G28_12250 [Actinobacteria bacterium]|nr:MAG: hypothetical protein E6G28_12250 [Actinomycetota bacterium]
MPLRRDPGRAATGGKADRLRQLQPTSPRVVDAPRSWLDPRQRHRGVEVIVSGTTELPASREKVWSVINEPEEMAKLIPGVESFELHDERHWTAKVKVPLGFGGLKMTMNSRSWRSGRPSSRRSARRGRASGRSWT